MTRKSGVLYDAAIEKIIDIFDELHPDRYIAVDLVMSDYEAAIQGSMSATFHGSECIGCFFHYAQVHLCVYYLLSFIINYQTK
jgi:hypothetical protein